MTKIKKFGKYSAYTIIIISILIAIYTFIQTDILKKDYANIFGHSYFVVSSSSMSGTLEVNDIIIMKLTKNVNINDIVVYKNKNNEIVTHRLKDINGNSYILKGDKNKTADDPVKKEAIIGVVTHIIHISFILKVIAIIILIIIVIMLMNYEKIIEKYTKKGKVDVPEEIFYSAKRIEEKHSGKTVVIPIKELDEIKEEKKSKKTQEIELLDFDEIIESDEEVKEETKVLEQVLNILKMRNESHTTTRINPHWLKKYQYVYKLSLILLEKDQVSLEKEISNPTFKEIYDYDLEEVGLTNKVRNKIYEMPIHIFLKILVFSILYNDIEFFDGIYKIMKYKIKIDKNNCFKEIQDSYSREEIEDIIKFMKNISIKFDNKKVFELEKIEKGVKLNSYVNQ